jgi:hypothetical protein
MIVLERKQKHGVDVSGMNQSIFLSLYTCLSPEKGRVHDVSVIWARWKTLLETKIVMVTVVY